MENKNLIPISNFQAAYAHTKEAKLIKNTPLELHRKLSEKYECNIYLKREDLQDVRSFKIRGALYAV